MATTITLAGSQAKTRLARGCDRCGAPFVDVAVLPNGSELQFCQHHIDKHRKALNSAGATWRFG